MCCRVRRGGPADVPGLAGVCHLTHGLRGRGRSHRCSLPLLPQTPQIVWCYSVPEIHFGKGTEARTLNNILKTADLDIFGLELMNVALNVGGSALGRHRALLQLLRQDVWAALALAACRPNLATLSHACQVCHPSYNHLNLILHSWTSSHPESTGHS